MVVDALISDAKRLKLKGLIAHTLDEGTILRAKTLGFHIVPQTILALPLQECLEVSSIVSAITGGISGNTGGAGMNYQAGSANLLNPATTEQANQQYQNAQTGLQGQQDFLKAVQAQNGLGNQSSVFNQMQGVANGTGPNPAQAMLANATGANVANQAALMAGQRGANQNVGMMTRQAAQQGATTQQQAAGQGAAMQANQSLGALGQMGSLATNQANQQANATNAYSNAAQGEQGQILGAITGQNNAQVGNMASQNQANSGISKELVKPQADFFGNLMSSAGSAAMMADGGQVQGTTTLNQVANPSQSGPRSFAGSIFNSMAPTSNAMDESPSSKAGATVGKGLGTGISSVAKGISSVFNDDAGGAGGGAMSSLTAPGGASMMTAMARGGAVPAMVSPGEKYLSPDKAAKVAAGKADAMKTGETIPGKPKVDGAKNSYANDTVPATLQEGGIVLPRSITQGEDAQKKAIAFVKAHFSQQSKQKRNK